MRPSSRGIIGSIFVAGPAFYYANKRITERKISLMVPHPLPQEKLSTFVLQGALFRKISEKPRGDLSGEIGRVMPPSPSSS